MWGEVQLQNKKKTTGGLGALGPWGVEPKPKGATRLLVQGLQAKAARMLQHVEPPILRQHPGVEEHGEVLHPGLGCATKPLN